VTLKLHRIRKAGMFRRVGIQPRMIYVGVDKETGFDVIFRTDKKNRRIVIDPDDFYRNWKRSGKKTVPRWVSAMDFNV